MWAPEDVLEKPCGDCEGGYIATAKNYLEGKGWVDNNRNFSAARTPGHSLIIVALVSIAKWTKCSESSIFRVFNTFMLGFSSILLFFIGRQIWGNKHILALPFVWMTCPFTLWFLNQPYSEMPYFVLFFGSLLLAIVSYGKTGGRQYMFAFAVGAATALAMMVRPIGIGLPVVYFMVFLLTVRKFQLERQVKYFAAMIFGVLVVIVPWSTIVYDKTGPFIFLTDGQLARNSVIAGVTFATQGKDHREELRLPPRVRVLLREIEQMLTTHPDESAVANSGLVRRVESLNAKELFYRIVKIYWKSPVASLQFMGIKFVRSWYGTYSHRHELLAAGLQMVYLGLVLLSVVRSIAYGILPKYVLVLVLSVTLYYWSMSVFFEPLVRYMVPALGMLFVLLPVLWCSKRERASPTGVRSGNLL